MSLRPAAAPPHILTLVALSALSALNMNMFLPSLPRIAQEFAAPYGLVQMSVSGYLAMTAVLQLIIGPLSDRYGRRPVILGALAVHIAASAGSALAPEIWSFLALRMFSAAVVACMALTRAVVRDMHPPEQSASMIGYVTMGMAVAPMIGPALGGVIDEALGWRAVFWALGGCGAAALIVAWLDLGETHGGGGRMIQQMRAYPALLRSRAFWIYALGAALSSGAFFAFLGGAPWVADHVYGLSPAGTGALFGMTALGYAFGNYLSGRYATRFGLAPMMGAGAVIALAGVLLSGALVGGGMTHPLGFFAPITLMGVGNGVGLPSAMAGSISVRPDLAGSAAGLGGALMVGGGAALSSLSGTLLGAGWGVASLIGLMAGCLVLAGLTAAAARGLR